MKNKVENYLKNSGNVWSSVWQQIVHAYETKIIPLTCLKMNYFI